MEGPGIPGGSGEPQQARPGTHSKKELVTEGDVMSPVPLMEFLEVA